MIIAIASYWKARYGVWRSRRELAHWSEVLRKMNDLDAASRCAAKHVRK